MVKRWGTTCDTSHPSSSSDTHMTNCLMPATMDRLHDTPVRAPWILLCESCPGDVDLGYCTHCFTRRCFGCIISGLGCRCYANYAPTYNTEPSAHPGPASTMSSTQTIPWGNGSCDECLGFTCGLCDRGWARPGQPGYKPSLHGGPRALSFLQAIHPAVSRKILSNRGWIFDLPNHPPHWPRQRE